MKIKWNNKKCLISPIEGKEGKKEVEHRKVSIYS